MILKIFLNAISEAAWVGADSIKEQVLRAVPVEVTRTLSLQKKDVQSQIVHMKKRTHGVFDC